MYTHKYFTHLTWLTLVSLYEIILSDKREMNDMNSNTSYNLAVQMSKLLKE